MASAGRKLIRRILVAVEPGQSTSSLDCADRIARALDASLSAVQVVQSDAAEQKVLGSYRSLTETVAEGTGRDPASFDASVRCGDAAKKILEQVEEEDVDLIVVGTHERQGLDRWQSVSAAVARAAKSSVLVSRSSSPTRGPVLVACDLGPTTGSVLATAGELAAKLHETVIAVHAVEPNRHDLLLIASAIVGGTVTPQPDASTVDAYREVTQGALGAELAAAGVDGRPEIAVGQAAAVVVERARELKASLIVVGTHDRRGLGRLLIGSVAEAIVRDAPCSVLIVRSAEQLEEPEQKLESRDTLAKVAMQAIEGVGGAAAGAIAGSVAGPIGAVAGAALGAAAGVALGRKAEAQQHEAALTDRSLDAIDAEREFFAHDAEGTPTPRDH